MNRGTLRELSGAEIDRVSGGDSWAGTPEGRAPAEGAPSSVGQVFLAMGLVALALLMIE